MGRRITPAAYRQLVERARAAIPGVAITTDLITGFPGEDAGEFQRGARFVEGIGFSGGHVFVYSPRPGTPAARLPDRVPSRVGKHRSRRLRAMLAHSQRRFATQFVDAQLEVLWESAQKGASEEKTTLRGLTDNYLRVEAGGPETLRNTISTTRITGRLGNRLVGEILSSAT
jgi:threonylcarbamoyladenosine tRNA methylthiotransferase MtaB